jgi:hypothetical protein
MTTPNTITMALDGVTWTAAPPQESRDGLPTVTHEGWLSLAGRTLRVLQLSDGRRIIDAADLEAFFCGPEGA